MCASPSPSAPASAGGAGDRAAGAQDALAELGARGDAEEQTAVGLAQAWSWGRGGSKPQRGSTWERAPEEGFRVEKKWEPV